jgi:hypothetical protein
MADKVLSEGEQQLLLSQFDEIEKDRPAGTRAKDYIDRIKKLASFYNV